MSKKIILAVVLLGFIAFIAGGCGFLDKILSIKEDFKKEEPQINEEQPQQEMSELVVDTPEVKEPQINIEQAPIEEKTVMLFFGSPDGKNLVSVEKDIPKVEGIGRATINALIEGPEFQSGLVPTIPAGTELLDINVKDDGLCIVDFSQGLIANSTGGEMSEKMIVYSIVNTLCQFPTVDRVEFRIEGQKMDTLFGFTELAPAVTANTDMVQDNYK